MYFIGIMHTYYIQVRTVHMPLLVNTTIVLNQGMKYVTTLRFVKKNHKNKKQNLKYGILSSKEVEAIPCDRLLVDIIRPYKISIEGHDDPLILKALTIIDPPTG